MLELFLCLKPQNREYQVRLAIRKKGTCSGLQGALLTNPTPTILDPTDSFCPSSCSQIFESGYFSVQCCLPITKPTVSGTSSCRTYMATRIRIWKIYYAAVQNNVDTRTYLCLHCISRLNLDT